MTIEEAQIVAGIAHSADGECHVCGRALFDQLVKSFPEIPWDEWWKFEEEHHHFPWQEARY